jgi:arginine/ornithine N-succinyltransferase beta subunit
MSKLLAAVGEANANACGSLVHSILEQARGEDSSNLTPEALALVGVLLACVHGDGELIDRVLKQLERAMSDKGMSANFDPISKAFVELLRPAVLQNDCQGLRKAFEFASQNNDWICTLKDYFAALDSRLAAGAVSPPNDPYDYGISSYSLWREGLSLFAAEAFKDAEERLRVSEARYGGAGLTADATWSRFDLALIAMAVDDFRTSGQLVRSLPAEGLLGPPFQSFGQKMLRAFVDMDLSAWREAARDIMRHREFAEATYQKIFSVMEDRLKSRRRDFGFIVCKPVDDEMIDGLLKLAREVNLPSQPVEEPKMSALVGRSRSTLVRGVTPWDQGGLYLAALRTLGRGKELEVVGSGQIAIGHGGYWRKHRTARFVPETEHPYYQEYLLFQRRSEDEVAVEFAGNSVRSDQRDQRIGRFITESRVLFLKIHGTKIVESLALKDKAAVHVYANLLPPKSNDHYPFFEMVVRPLIADMTYDQVDRYRYSKSKILEEVLSAKGAQMPIMVLLPLLPDQLRQQLGKVRPETRAAQAALERFGFRKSDKYDALDAGQYFEIELPQLLRVAETHQLTAKSARRATLSSSERALYATLAPERSEMSEFVCVRALVRVGENQPDEVEVDEEACSAIGLGLHERVVLLGKGRPPVESGD